jgi:DNA-binding MarR family transcriptional regulator
MSKDSNPSFQTASAGFLANQMARLFAHALAEALAPLKLAPAQFMTLLELWEKEGVTQKDLVLRLDVEQATMASTLNRMERDGLIARRPHPEDSRAQLIFLTPQAKSLKEQAITVAREVNATALSDLDDTEKKTLIALMPRVIRALQKRREGQSLKKAPYSQPSLAMP